MKKLALISALLVCVSSTAFAKIGLRNLEEHVKHRQVCMPVPTTGSTSNGLDGVVFVKTVNGDTTPNSTADSATAPSTFSWPGKLDVILVDSVTDDTLVCTSVILTGTDQFGKTIKETVSSISETKTTTTNVFATVTAVDSTACTGTTGEAGDVLVVRQSLELGLTVKVKATADIESACISDLSDSSSQKCARINNGGTDDVESALELSTHSIDVGTAMFGAEGSEVAAAQDDLVCLRIRSSTRRY